MATFAELLAVKPTPKSDQLIGKGLLPEILPPIFNSQSLVNVLPDKTYHVTKKRIGKLAGFNASKRGQQRRLFSVPHPLFHRDASLFFEKNWEVVEGVLSQSTGSASKPVFPMNGFRAVDITPQAALPTKRLQTLARKRFCLITDVSRCFPSIYTHAIPWALDGKELAKTDRRENSSAVRGNRLDFILRQSQDGQTSGIAVGPDISRLTSELILSRIDSDSLQQDRKKVYFVRHVDDYWIGGDTIEECENHLRRLRIGLGDYQLDINEAKTRIVPLSHAIGESWPTELKAEIEEIFPRLSFGNTRARDQDVTALLAKIIERSVTTQDDGIIKYAIRRIDRSRAWGRSWDVLEPFLAHCAIQFPHSFDYAARVVAWRSRRDEPCDKRLWKDVALNVAASAAAVGHESELLWALWLMKELNLRLTSTQVDQFATFSGPLVLSFLAHLTVSGLGGKTSFLDDLETMAIGDEQFTGTLWPLTLELYHLNHSLRLEAHRAAGNSVTGAYHAARVSIIDWAHLPRAFERDEDDHGRNDEWEPDYAIEDFASAYDDDEDDEDWGNQMGIGVEEFPL